MFSVVAIIPLRPDGRATQNYYNVNQSALLTMSNQAEEFNQLFYPQLY